MSTIKAQTLKGFRDFLPQQMRKRQYVINKLKAVFESFGFEPLETPALEYEEVLLGKYGTEGDKLMYRFTDNGGRKVALRYDQTVPLARVIAEYGNQLPNPFKRYQIQPVWRAENTQKGRFREFLQCDADIVGSSSPLSDAEIITVAAKTVEKLGFKNFRVIINDRANFAEIDPLAVLTIDKFKKIGEEGVLKELKEKGLPVSSLNQILNKTLTEKLEKITSALNNPGVIFDSTLARGLDYYTGLIFEIEIDGYAAGSVCGGGRYDELIGMFAGREIPAVGFAFGFDRIIEAMEQLDLFPEDLITTQVLVTVFSMELGTASIQTVNKLREANINSELWLEADTKLDKQLKYADQKGVPFTVIIGPEEAASGKVMLKNLRTKTQEALSLDEAIQKLTS